MNIKIDIKNKILWEKEKHSQFACFSKDASRQNPKPIELGLSFEIDRNKIINSKAFRRLKHKTQVF